MDRWENFDVTNVEIAGFAFAGLYAASLVLNAALVNKFTEFATTVTMIFGWCLNMCMAYSLFTMQKVKRKYIEKNSFARASTKHVEELDNIEASELSPELEQKNL